MMSVLNSCLSLSSSNVSSTAVVCSAVFRSCDTISVAFVVGMRRLWWKQGPTTRAVGMSQKRDRRAFRVCLFGLTT